MAAKIIAKDTLYKGWTTLIRARLRLDDGQEFSREVEDHGRAVAVLPYDPWRRTALLVRLMRAPALLTAGLADVLEAPAGLVEEDHPEDTARRELLGETGLRAQMLEHVGQTWTMPGLSTERMDLYLAPYSEHDRVGLGGGLAHEHENITVVEMALTELWSMTERNDIADMKTLTLILTLRLRHPQLFATAPTLA